MNVYDFDNTIYDGESCLDLFRFYIKKRPELLKFLPRVLLAFTKYKMGRVTVEGALSDYGKEVESFFASIPDIHADAEEFWDSHMCNIKSFYTDVRREDDLIITASPEATVEVVCERLGIKNMIGSVIDPETGKIERLCMRNLLIAKLCHCVKPIFFNM